MNNSQAKASVDAAIENAEATLHEASESLSQNAQALADEANRAATNTVSNVETYVKQKPLQAVGIAFAAGFVATMLLRRPK